MKLNEVQDVIEPQHVVNMINKQCQPFLHEVGGWDRLTKHMLYRGIKGERHRDVDIRQVHSGRGPSATPMFFHEAFDKEFAKRYGHKFRSNALFCSGKK